MNIKNICMYVRNRLISSVRVCNTFNFTFRLVYTFFHYTIILICTFWQEICIFDVFWVPYLKRRNGTLLGSLSTVCCSLELWKNQISMLSSLPFMLKNFRIKTDPNSGLLILILAGSDQKGKKSYLVRSNVL